MVGVAGIHEDSGELPDVLTEMHEEEWYETEVCAAGSFELGLVHPEGTDADGYRVWQTDGTAGILFGVISNWSDLGWDEEGLVDRVVDRPDRTVAELDGPFVLVATDGDQAVLATDKIGSRPLYFGEVGGGIVFGSSVGGVLGAFPEATLDEQAVSNMLLLGSVWGTKTLVTEVTAIPPGHVVEFSDGEVEMREYWRLDYGDYQGDFVAELLERYERSMSDIAATVTGRAGVWLSGGIDSRMMTSILTRELESVETFSYNRLTDFEKIVGTEDLELSPVIADHLGVENAVIELDQRRATELLPACIDLVDGQLPWNTLLNLAATFELPRDDVDVMFEGSGHSEFFGEDVLGYHLQSSNFSSPTAALTHRHGRTTPDRVQSMLDVDAEPTATLQQEVNKSDESRFQDIVMDVNNRNLFSRFQFLSNRVTRSQFGSRLPFADGTLLSHLAQQPRSYRMQTVPLTRGKIPWGFSRTKIDMIRRLNRGLDRITYERTGLRPDQSYLAHGLGFVAENVVNRLASHQTLDRWLLPGSTFSAFVLDSIDAAAERPIFDTGAVETLASEYVEGDPDTHMVATVTTIERWARDYVDG
jgi:asparagine synthase (glutamine-hydrolysing)